MSDIETLCGSIAYCGLVCRLCFRAGECDGCKTARNACDRNCADEGCYQKKCCTEKGIEGCWLCPDIRSCDKGIYFAGNMSKIKAFAICIREDGKRNFIRHIVKNTKRGWSVEKGKDYDDRTIDEVLLMLRKGKTYRREPGCVFPIPAYRDLIDGFYRKMLRNRKLADATLPDGEWTLKEMVGHLIDSASNNHQRFIRLQLDENVRLPGYEAETWKGVSKVGPVDYRFLVNLWRDCNLFLLHIISSIDETKLCNTWENDGEKKTLEFLVADYFEHIKWHIDFFDRRVRELKNAK